MAAKLKIRPVGGNILVKPQEEEETTKSGLIVQSSGSGERPQKGEIVSLGTGAKDDSGKDIAFNVKIGDVVMFKKYSPEEVEVEGEKYLIMKEADILAVFE